MDALPNEQRTYALTTIEDYEPLVGSETIERILEKAGKLRDLHVVNVNSTYYGGGVAELLSSLTLLMNAAGIKTGWRVIQGRPDFFSITKKMHNALQGAEINLSDLKRSIYEEVVFENAARMHIDHDVVIVHDPQPLPLIGHFRTLTTHRREHELKIRRQVETFREQLEEQDALLLAKFV